MTEPSPHHVVRAYLREAEQAMGAINLAITAMGRSLSSIAQVAGGQVVEDARLDLQRLGIQADALHRELVHVRAKVQG